jgi:hypothetical protein
MRSGSRNGLRLNSASSSRQLCTVWSLYHLPRYSIRSRNRRLFPSAGASSLSHSPYRPPLRACDEYCTPYWRAASCRGDVGYGKDPGMAVARDFDSLLHRHELSVPVRSAKQAILPPQAAGEVLAPILDASIVSLAMPMYPPISRKNGTWRRARRSFSNSAPCSGGIGSR